MRLKNKDSWESSTVDTVMMLGYGKDGNPWISESIDFI